MKVGVLAFQGGYAAHIKMLDLVGIRSSEVRTRGDLENLDGLILPGGESSTQLKLLSYSGMKEELVSFIKDGSKKIFGTCAGLILLAAHVVSPSQESFSVLDIRVKRNGYGSQLQSFETLTDKGRAATFIRAPRIEWVDETKCRVVDTLNKEPIMVCRANVLGATYHPELAGDSKIYEDFFLGLNQL